MRILGIDPGASGAIALLDGEGRLKDVWDMPTMLVRRGKRDVQQVSAVLLGALLGPLDVDVAYVEQVGAMPGQGVSSMFAFGRAMGVIEGVLGSLLVPCHLAPPVAWKRAMRVDSAKDSSRHRAIQLWPAKADLFARVRDDGRAEAALIGLYGLRSMRPEGQGSTPALERALAAL